MAIAKDFCGRPVEAVDSEIKKPSPTEYPALLPTLQTWAGMVLGNGEPTARPIREQILTKDVEEQLQKLYKISQLLLSHRKPPRRGLLDKVRNNLVACVEMVTKNDLIQYLSHGKRVDVEQAVAMVIAYFRVASDIEDFEIIEKDELEEQSLPVIEELLNDMGVSNMLLNTAMWREPGDRNLLGDSRERSACTSWMTIAQLLNEVDPSGAVPEYINHRAMVSYLQNVRRRRAKLGNTQHLTFPDEFLPDEFPQRDQWSWDYNYKTRTQPDIPITNPIIISKHRFRTLQRLLYHLAGPTDTKSVYVLDVERFIKSSGSISPQRLAALEASEDPYAIAYSFITAQRHRQLKVVSDPRWTRFLVKDEGAMILQNRPDVLTSFEDILVRRATDLTALTAVSCPKGLRDNFSTKDEVLQRTRKVCEFMERYVRDFGFGRMECLVFNKDVGGGSGRGPVDVYNALCDELKDCKARAKALDMELEIGHVQKFLAKDIMQWNNAWADDAFANGKIPGWVEYLARVRLADANIS